jgi:CARDB
MWYSTLKGTGLAAIAVAALAGLTDQAASRSEPPSASPSGGEALRPLGSADLTRDQLAEFIRTYRGPDPNDFVPEGEVHEDDEAAPRAAPAPLAAPSLAGASLPLESPPPTTSWKAMDAMGGIAADAQIAVSTTHVLVTNRATLRFFDKAGTQPKTLSAVMLFSPLGLNSPSFQPAPIDGYFDMRAIFDPYRKRFWVTALGINNAWRSLPPASMRHITAVAVSKTENPADGWYLYWWDAVPHWGVPNDKVYQTGDASDYPTIGIDATLFHETHAVNNYTSTPKTYKFWRVTFFGADQMAAGLSAANVPSWQFWDLVNPDGTTPTSLIQAVVHHTASSRSFYVSRIKIDQQTPGTVLVVWSLTKPFQPGQKMTAVSVSLPTAWELPSDGLQPPDVLGPNDTTIKMTNLGTSPLKAVFRKDLLYLVTNDGLSPFTGVRYVRLSVATYPTITLDAAHQFISRTFGVTDDIEGGPFAWSAWPAVEVNKSGNAAFVFARVSTVVYPEVRFSTYFASEPDIRLSRLLKAGEATYHDGFNNIDKDGKIVPMPWGDTAGASVDPKDDSGIWIAQSYSTTSGPPNYAIWVGKVFGGLYFDWLFQNARVESVDATNRQLTVAGQLHNGGDGAAPDSEVTFYLDAGTRTVASLGMISQSGLRPGETTDFRATLPLPPVGPGPYQLRAVISTKLPKNEYSTGNNTAVVPFDLR